MRYKYHIYKYDINVQSPGIELCRYKLMNEIISDVKKILNKHNIKIDVLARWIFSNSAHRVDPIFPFDGINNVQLIKDISNLNKDAAGIIKELNLTERFNNAIMELRNIYPTINENKYKIYNKTDWYYIDVINSKYKLAQCKPLHKNLYQKLQSFYTGDPNMLTSFIISIIIRYETLESGNLQLAVNPQFYQKLKRYGFAHELFASIFNCYFNSYCSLFPDLEQHFGSKGNFNDFEIISGLYVANPPFDEEVAKNMANKLVSILKSQTNYIGILITLPAWDNFEALSILEKSTFQSMKVFVPKNKINFFNYYENKSIPAVNTWFILIQNKKTNLAAGIKEDIKQVFFTNVMKGGSNKANLIDSEGFQLVTHNKHKTNPLIVNIKHLNSGDLIEDIKYYNEPQEYRLNAVKKFYIHKSKFDATRLIHILNVSRYAPIKFDIISNITSLLENIYDTNTYSYPMNVCCIDLTYSCDHFSFIHNRLKKNYTALNMFFLRDKLFSEININYYINPRYLYKDPKDYINYFTNISDTKMNFIFISGNLDYYESKAISYYTEQISYVLYLCQAYIVLSNQIIGGSFIYFFYSCDTPIFRKIIALFQNNYENVYLFHLFDGTNISYIVGKGYIGCSDKYILKPIIEELIKMYPDFGENINIYSEELRNKHNVVKYITKPATFSYLHNIYNYTALNTEYLNRKINTFLNAKYENGL